MRVAPAFLLALAAVVGAGAREAAADPEPIPLRLELTAPPGCPDAPDFRREMERRGTATRSPSVAEKAGSMHVEVVAKDSAPGVIAHLVWTDDQDKTAERQLEAPDCAAAINALALIAALAVARGAAPAAPTPSAASAGLASPAPSAPSNAAPAPRPPPQPPPPPPPSPSRAPAPVPAASAARDRIPAPPLAASENRAPAVSFSATAGAFVSLGSAPSAAFGVLALAGVAIARDAAIGPVVVRAGIDAVPARSYSVASEEASFGTLAAVGEVCPLSLHVGPRAFVSPCVLGEFGAESASGPGGENALTRPWAAAGVEARLAVPIVGSLFFDASIDGMAAIDRNRFHVGDTLVYETPPAVGRVALGLGWLIP